MNRRPASTLPYFQVDAFADSVFRGNPAGVCPLADWLDDELLRAIAAENGLSETAFFITDEAPSPLRWFTPTEEVPLCGHATLAAAFVLFNFLQPSSTSVTFDTRSGPLTVVRAGDAYVLDFPAVPLTRVDPPPALTRGLDTGILETWASDADPNFVAVLPDERQVRQARPDMRLLARLHPRGVALTAPGSTVDFVSRYFAPGYGIREDPATGSIQCALAPYWAARLGRTRLTASQLSARGGSFGLQLVGDRVHLTGHAVCYLRGEIRIP